jgi:hypothetical protein
MKRPTRKDARALWCASRPYWVGAIGAAVILVLTALTIYLFVALRDTQRQVTRQDHPAALGRRSN